jgi:hypothetical protein
VGTVNASFPVGGTHVAAAPTPAEVLAAREKGLGQWFKVEGIELQ